MILDILPQKSVPGQPKIRFGEYSELSHGYTIEEDCRDYFFVQLYDEVLKIFRQEILFNGGYAKMEDKIQEDCMNIHELPHSGNYYSEWLESNYVKPRMDALIVKFNLFFHSLIAIVENDRIDHAYDITFMARELGWVKSPRSKGSIEYVAEYELTHSITEMTLLHFKFQVDVWNVLKSMLAKCIVDMYYSYLEEGIGMIAPATEWYMRTRWSNPSYEVELVDIRFSVSKENAKYYSFPLPADLRR
jgi:hypothetical protein